MRENEHNERARQTILYVCKKMEHAGGFGSVLLNKVLYFIDHTNFVKTGDTVTGFSYVKQLRGPTPKPAQFLSLKDDMLRQSQICEKTVAKFAHTQIRTIARVEADVAVFSSEEIALMDEVIEDFMDSNATAASDLTHEMLAWQIAERMEELPDYTYLLTEADLTEEDIQWGGSIVAKYAAA